MFTEKPKSGSRKRKSSHRHHHKQQNEQAISSQETSFSFQMPPYELHQPVKPGYYKQ